MSLKLIKRSLILFELAEMQIFNISKGLKPLPHQNTRISVFEAIIKRKIGFEYKEYTCATCRPWGQILLYCIYRHSLTSKECIVFCWKKTIIFILKVCGMENVDIFIWRRQSRKLYVFVFMKTDYSVTR